MRWWAALAICAALAGIVQADPVDDGIAILVDPTAARIARQGAIEILARTPDPRAITALATTFERDPDRELRTRAGSALVPLVVDALAPPLRKRVFLAALETVKVKDPTLRALATKIIELPALTSLREAARFIKSGTELYNRGDFTGAIIAWEEAFRRSPAEVIAQLGLAHAYKYAADKQEPNLRRAVELLEAYVADPEIPTRLSRAIEVLATLDAPFTKLLEEDARRAPPPPPPPPPTVVIISSPIPTARVVFEDQVEQPAPVPITTTAGEHHIRVSAPGYRPVSRTVKALANQTVSFEVPLAELPAALVVRAEVVGRVAIDGVDRGPTGAELAVPAGRHRVTVTHRGHYAWERDLELVRGDRVTVEATLPTTTQRTLSAYVMGGAGVALLAGVTTTIFAVAAQGNAEDYNTRVASGGVLTESERVDYNDQIARRDSFRTASYILYGTAIAGATASVLLYLLDTPTLVPGTSSSVVAPAISPDGVSVTWSRPF